jgi:DNA polymerase
VAKFLGVGVKPQTILKTKGKSRKEIEGNRFLYKEFTSYCLNDVELCRQIYLKLVNKFPATEHIIMDMIIKTTTQLQLQLNTEHLQEHLKIVQAEKAKSFEAISEWFTIADLMSNPKFADALKFFGVTPPTKISPTTHKLTWAFSKNDFAFIELLNHPDPIIQALIAARMKHKSTLEETRTQKFISIANVTMNSYGQTYLPMALKYSGAHTHRFGGDWGINTMNLPARKSKKLRQSITAPKGYVILAVDAAQIEARLTAWFAGQKDLLKAFEEGRDVYKEFATVLFQKSIDQITKGGIERFIAKTCILGLGFQLGKVKLLNTLITKAKEEELEATFTIEQTAKWVDIYRNKHNDTKQYWYHLKSYFIPLIANGHASTYIAGCCKVKHQEIVLPNGLSLYYNQLQLNEAKEWWYVYGGRWKKLYGGKLLENLVQALDRVIVMDAAMRVFKRTGIRIAHQIHDELLYVVLASEVDSLKQIVLEEMQRRPSFALDLPLKAEAKIGDNYGDL